MKFRDVLLALGVILFFVIVGSIAAVVRGLMGYSKVALLVVLFVSQVAAQDSKLFTPSQAVAMAAADLRTIQPDARPFIRYLSLYNIAENKRGDFTQTLNGHINGLSTESDIIKPTVVPNTGNSLLRVLISDYGWGLKVWEKLRDAEPYFHAFIEEVVDEPYGIIGADGKWRQTETRKEKVRKFSAQAPWLTSTKADATAVAFLVSQTASEVPLIRADWFLWQTGLQADRTPGYYDFLGVKKLKDFETLVGFDAALAKKSKRTEYLEAIAESGIAQQPRRIRRDNTIGGMGFWQTFDQRAGTDKNNPLRVLDNENFKFDASEMFGSLPNNFWAYALFAANGDRQDSAPDFIGHDSTSRSNDGRIHVGLSCIRCHNIDSGIKPIDAWARNLLQPPLALQSPLPEKIRELRQQYLRDILGPIDDDKRTFERALREATGYTPKQYAQAYGTWFAAYDGGVDVERAGADLGVAGETFRKALDRQLIASSKEGIIINGERVFAKEPVDTVLSVFLRPKETQKLVGIRQWQEAYPIAQQCLAAYPEKK